MAHVGKYERPAKRMLTGLQQAWKGLWAVRGENGD